MKVNCRDVSCFSLIFLLLLMTGCTSMRFTTSLKPGQESPPRNGQVKFHILPENDKLRAASERFYPGAFSDDWTALPVRVEIKEKRHSPFSPFGLLAGFTLGALPIYYTSTAEVDVTTSLVMEEETRKFDPVRFKLKTATWGSLLTPLALLPVPGPSDAPRRTIVGGGDGNWTDNPEYDLRSASVIEAVMQALKQADPSTLEQAYAGRQARTQQVTVDGETKWSFLGFSTSDPNQPDGPRDRATLLLFNEPPTWKEKPVEAVTVATLEANGHWRPVNAYLRTARQLTAAGVLLEQGRPARVALRTVDEPLVEDFIETPALTGREGAEALRWSNDVLLEAKNRSLPRLLRERTSDELLGLVTRIEKSILDLNEQTERAKDRAQRIVEKGEGDPDPERELAILFRQRIEVLKPILVAIKQTAAVGGAR